MLPKIETLGLPNEFHCSGTYYCKPLPGITACVSQATWTRPDKYKVYFWLGVAGDTVAHYLADDELSALAIIHYFIATYKPITHGGNHD